MTAAQTMSTEHQKTLEAIAAARAAGEDPLGDNDPLEVVDDDDDAATAADDTSSTAADAGADGKVESVTTPTDPATPAAADDTDPAAEVPATFHVEQKDFQAERQTLRTREQEIDAKWAAGELTDEERTTQLATVRDGIEALLKEQTRAETIVEINRQNVIRSNQQVIETLRREGPKVGIDYKPGSDHAVEFDAQLQVVRGLPKFANSSFADQANEAHRRMVKLYGTAPAATTTTTASTPAARVPPKAPLTLRDVPAASTPQTGGDDLASLGRLEGVEYQAAFTKLSPAQKARLLDE